MIQYRESTVALPGGPVLILPPDITRLAILFSVRAASAVEIAGNVALFTQSGGSILLLQPGPPIQLLRSDYGPYVCGPFYAQSSGGGNGPYIVEVYDPDDPLYPVAADAPAVSQVRGASVTGEPLAGSAHADDVHELIIQLASAVSRLRGR